MISLIETNQQQNDDPQAWSNSLVRPLLRRYLLVLITVAALVLLDQAILQPLLIQLNVYAPVINLAGRQRMLSQKVTKEVLAIQAMDESNEQDMHRADLRHSVEQWSAAHRALLHGDSSKGIEPVAPSVAKWIQAVDPSLESIRRQSLALALKSEAHDSSEVQQMVKSILADEPIYLAGMERAVGMLEEAAKSRIVWLRACGLIAMLVVLLLLVSVYFVVLVPAARLIHRQVQQLAVSNRQHRQMAEMLSEAHDRLELRVIERTSELSLANAALAREMSDRQAAERRMRDLSTELAHVSRVTSLGELATGLAHEINQPLATVANYAGTLELKLERACPTDNESRNLVSQMKQAALRAGSIVRTIRNFVRGGNPQVSLVELNDLVHDVTELCRPKMQEAKLEWTLQLETRPINIMVDSLQIQQVIVNFIQNAIQAMDSLSSRKILTIRTRVVNDDATLIVMDSGVGFSQETMEKCLQPFFTTKPEGLGMGLAISKTIIEQHQGSLWCKNVETGGAEVGFRLPLYHQLQNSQA
jgi:two-component system sensor kinase FixL